MRIVPLVFPNKNISHEIESKKNCLFDMLGAWDWGKAEELLIKDKILSKQHQF